MKFSTGSLLAISILLCLISATKTQAQVSTTFDSDLEGWQVTGDNSAAWEATTGNPGGCLSVNDWATGAMNWVIAPSVYHGDWSYMTALDSLSVEIFHSSSDPDDVPPEYIFRIAGPGGSAYTLSGAGYQPVKDVWNRFIVSLDSTDWTIEAGTWSDIVHSINSLRICGEFTSGNEICRIDNVHLTSTPSYVFIPCAYDDFNTAGTGDWSFSETGGVSNPGSGGNGGGYITVSDGTGLSKALAPAKFLGDWSSLNNSGYVTIDLRIISRSGTDLGVAEFIRISGPGGSAHVDLDPADLPESSLIWKTFVYPINPATWTLDSGTWPGLLSNVTECRIIVEYYDGSESIGIDNFGRLEIGCPPIDNTVQIHDPNTNDCGYHSFVNISSVALNPKDGGIYGIVSATTGSGGGIYPVTGSGSGIRIQAYDRPAHLIFDTDGDAFISESYAGEIYRLEWLGASSLWVSGFHSGDDDPCGMTFAPAGFDGPNVNPGDILVVDQGYSTDAYDCVYAFSPDSAEGERLVLPDPGTYDFYDIAAGPNDTVYVSDAYNVNGLFILDTLGTITPLTMNTTVTNINSVVYDDVEDDIYIASKDSLAVYRVEPSTGDVTLVADGFVNLVICCLEIDTARRRLWVADKGYNRIYEICLGALTAVENRAPLLQGARPLEVFPNPFNPSTTIRFVLFEFSNVRLDIFDVSGRRVRRLLDEKFGAGEHEVSWDGRNTWQERVPSGVYFVRITAGNFTETVKTVLIK